MGYCIHENKNNHRSNYSNELWYFHSDSAEAKTAEPEDAQHWRNAEPEPEVRNPEIQWQKSSEP